MQQLLRLPVNLHAVSALLTPFYFLFQSKKLLLRLAMLVMSVGMMSGVVGQATVINDKPDYAPLSNAVFTGAGFAPFEQVVLKVKNLTQPCNTVSADSSYFPWTVTADANGGFVTNWTVCNCPGDSLRLKAVGQTSGLIAYAFFTDGIAIASVTVGTQNGILTYGTGGSATYSLALTRTAGGAGGNSAFTANITSSALPQGVSLSPSNVSFGNNVISVNTNFILTTSATSPGGVFTFTVTASGPNGGATSSNVTLTINKLNQTITFANPGTKTYGDADFNLGATTSSGLPVTYNVLSGPATIVSDNMLHITGAGSVTVRASQAGNENYNAAAIVDQTFTIAKANPTVVVTGYNVTYDGQPHTATYSITGVNGETGATVGTINVSATTHTNAGTYNNDAWSFTGTANYIDANGTVNNAITKANATINVTGYSGVYDGVAHGATGSATGVLSEVLSGLNLGASYTNVPGGTANWTFTDVTGNYNNASGSVEIVITKANATINVTGYSGVYDGVAHGATGSATGVLSEVLSGLNLGASYTNVPGGTANWTFTDVTGNYNNASGSVEIVITKANATINVTGYSGVYDGVAHGATGSATGVLSEVLSGLNLGASYTNVPGGTANWTFTDVTGNYNNASGSVEIVITKANATINVTGYSGVYDGVAHGATGSATGVLSEVLSGLNLGASYTNVPGGTANWTFTDVTGNYNNASGSVEIVITKANATINVTGYSGVYDGVAHGATGSATGVLSEVLSGLNLGASYTNVPGGTANWTFTDVTGNYNNASGSVEIVITKANATINVTGYSGVYDGVAHGATGSATGVLSEVLSGLNLGASYTNVPGGTANWTFTDVTGNYNNASGSVEIVITKANATINVTGYSGVYDGVAHGATGSATGVLSEVLSGLNLGASYTNVPGGTANWTFTDVTGNYNNASGSVEIVITKANATINVTGYSGVYDGVAHGATGSATGVLSEVLSGLNLGASYTNVPGGTANWTFTDVTGNYNNASGSVEIVITKANATINVTGYSGVYDGVAHGATGSATGVLSEVLSGLNLGASYTNVPGGTANWTFTDVTGNYNNASGSVEIVITKANATINVTGYSGVYDGVAHGATGSATGVLSEVLSGLNLGASYTNVPGGTANWTFTDVTGNYNNASGSVEIVITKANATINVTGYSGVYDGVAHGATGSATGVLSEVLSGLNLGASYTNVPGGTANWTFTDVTGNYNNASGSVEIVITKANATINVTGYSGVYDGVAHGATGSATGVLSEVLSGLNLGASYTNVPGGTANWTFTDVTGNYNNASGSVEIVITKANATINVTGYSGVYDGVAHGATGSATGVLSEVLSGLNLGASYTNVPGGTANWTFTDVTGNYNNASGSVQILISTKAASVTPNTANKYCGQADPVFTGTLSGFINSDNVVPTYGRTSGEAVGGSYVISATLSPIGVLGNYNITYNTASFTINGLAIDASASSTPVAIGQNATLSAVVSPAVAGVTVKFYVDGVEKGFGVTDGSGIATYTLTGLNTTDVYKIEAVAGTGGCASTAAYLPVYDPNGAFVTGGGWINSPAGSLTANSSIVGKANFGFVSKYKKGSNIVDGNTEFQFHAGDINFKSTMHESGSLVISGAKATYRGTGTINGLAGYKFTIVAIDGNWNNAVGPDKFRIKITTTAGAVIYDNQMGKDDNADDATVLGGGSIVIHEVKKKTSNRMDPGVLVLTPQEFGVKVLGNPSLTSFRLQLQSNNMQEKFTVKVVDINGRLIEVQQNLYTGQVIELGSKYTQGTYFAEVMQGTNRKVVKLIKIGRD